MNIEIWPGYSNFAEYMNSGSPTPFGFYDSDSEFQIDADKVANFCARRLGYPIMDVELQDINFWAAFEEAVTLYGNEVYAYKIRDNYLSLEGSERSDFENQVIINSHMGTIIRLSKQYGTEAGSGGNVTWYKDYIDIVPNQQDYDLIQWASNKNISGSIEIKRIFSQGPPALMRYFDPYGGAGFGYQGMMSEFGWGSYSPAINFLLMPLSFDIQRIQAIEFNDQVRRAAYSFELVNNQLRVFPVPQQNTKLWFEYIKVSEREANAIIKANSQITDVTDVPYINPTYSRINSIGRKWIFDYTLAAAKETLGYVRNKYNTVPIPGSETTLNGETLVSNAQAEKEKLIDRLRIYLDETSRKSLLERRSEEGRFKHEEINRVPLPIYIA